MPELHTRLLADVIALGSPYPLVLTGGYAVRAHRLVNRPSQDLDVATENPAPMADIAATLRAGLEARGWKVHALETAPLSARFTVADPATGQECEVDILKEIFWRPVAQSPYGPVLAEEDVIGTKVRALADRGAPRDLIDVFAASAAGPMPSSKSSAAATPAAASSARICRRISRAPSGPTTKPFPPTGSRTPRSSLSALGPWSGPTTSRPVSSKRPMIRTSTDHVRMRSHLQSITARTRK